MEIPMSSETTGPKQSGRRFTPGTSGNPSGRPRGSRHTALLALDRIGAEGAEDVMRSVVSAAKNGDMQAAGILLKRLWPERKGRPVQLDLPTISKPSDIVAALGAVTAAVANAEISAEEGAAVAGILEAQRRAAETADLEARIVTLEQNREYRDEQSAGLSPYQARARRALLAGGGVKPLERRLVTA